MLGTVEINYKGTKIPLRFNNWAFFALLEDFKVDPDKAMERIQEIQDKEGVMGVVKLVVRYGDLGYAKENQIDLRMSDKDIHSYVSSGSLHEMLTLVQEFSKWCLGIMSPEEEAETPKKKVTKKR